MADKALVIVPTYNEKENIRSLIDAVLPKDERIEMLIVDDNSPDGTGDIVEAISR
jgi:dolichol-phosphate mannosyltransferase